METATASAAVRVEQTGSKVLTTAVVAHLARGIVALLAAGVVLVTSRGMGPILLVVAHGRGVHLADLLVIAVAVSAAGRWAHWVEHETRVW